MARETLLKHCRRCMPGQGYYCSLQSDASLRESLEAFEWGRVLLSNRFLSAVEVHIIVFL
jgi:hypothetical protein